MPKPVEEYRRWEKHPNKDGHRILSLNTLCGHREKDRCCPTVLNNESEYVILWWKSNHMGSPACNYYCLKHGKERAKKDGVDL